MPAMRRITGDGAAARGLAEFSRMGHVRDLVSSESSLNQAAWEGLRGVVALLGSGGESRIGFGGQGSIPRGGGLN